MIVAVFVLLVICALGYLGALLSTPKPAAREVTPASRPNACGPNPFLTPQERFDREGLPRGTFEGF